MTAPLTPAQETLAPGYPVFTGERIRPVYGHIAGPIVGDPVTVKWVDSSGTPMVRFRFGKVDKPVHNWISATPLICP